MNRAVASLAALLLWPFGVSIGLSASAAYTTFGFNAAVPGLAGRTWLDLVQQALPGAEADPASPHSDAEGAIATPIRIMPGDREAGDDKDSLDLAQIDAARIEIGGKPRWVALGEQDVFGLAPLMLFDAENGKLLDAVDVVADRHSSMDNAGPLSLGRDAAVVGIRDWHDVSDRGDDHLKLVLIASDRFGFIGHWVGTWERQPRLVTSEALSFHIHPDRGHALAAIEITRERDAQKLAEDGKTKVGKPAVKRTLTMLRWNAAQKTYEKARR